MPDQDFDAWKAITDSSRDHWTEDTVTRLNGKGSLYYIGGESGRYMHISPDGLFTAGTYEDAVPHIGKAFFSFRVKCQYDSYNDAMEAACNLGGHQFLEDMFSQSVVFQETESSETNSSTFEMKM